jgi:PAS domain S-box-containing protein
MMFNFEQLNVDSSFRIVDAQTQLVKIKALLNEVHFVIIEASFTYVIGNDEYKYMDQFDPDMTIEESIRRTSWPHSTLCYLTQLTGPGVSWERPVVISQAPAGIKGIVTPDAMIKCLINEKKQLTSYLSTFVETVNDAVTAVDREGRVIYWNKTAEQVYGINKEEIIGRKIGEHFDKESIMLHQILDEGRTVRQIYHQPTPNTHVLINASPIVDNNQQIIGGIATEQDITRIVRLNEELYSTIPLRIEQDKPFSSIIGMGHAFQHSLEVAQKFANFSTPVLLIGEPGSGKEMLAQAIHFSGGRKDGVFLTLHCGAIPGGLLETELFGYQGGAFTSEEYQGKEGKLELAAGGTLFLEEIGLMPLDIQLKLIQFLKTKSFYRMGGEHLIETDTRIIATTQFSLQPMMEQGLFLEELYYHLNVMSIEIPPLRERTEDIPELVLSFIREFTAQYAKPNPKLNSDVMTALMNYDWPGNIRELRNVMERMIILCDGESITVKQLPQGLASTVLNDDKVEEEALILKSKFLNQKEDSIINEAIRKAYGNKSAAAKMLGISRGTLYKKMKEYDIRL